MEKSEDRKSEGSVHEEHHDVYVREGAGKTANEEGARSKGVANVRSNSSLCHSVQPI